MDGGSTDHVALDYETYYDNDCSIKGTTARNYARMPLFDAYMVSIWHPEFQFVGHPKDFNWNQLRGKLVVAHNASFDEAITRHLVEQGVIPSVEFEWHCTADMCVFFQLPRSLAGACYAAYDREVSNDVRDKLKGHDWNSIKAQGWEQDVTNYALDDAKFCWELWRDYGHRWPDIEKLMSRVTRNMGYKGVRVDRSALDAGISHLEKVVFEAETDLPWCNEYDSKYKKNFPPTSVRGLALTCAQHGIDPPGSTAENSEERAEWEKQYGDQFPFIRHMSNWRKANKHLKVLKTIRNRLLDDDSMPYGLKYYGAEVTGRWSGDAGFNTQNMPRDPQFGINIRNLIIPRPGKKFVISDLSQIEPRCLAYLSSDWEFLKQIRTGMSPYEVHARQSMGWKGGALKEEDKDLYLLAKVRVLSLGCGASWQSFVRSAAAYGASYLLQETPETGEIDAFRKYLRQRDARTGQTLLEWFDRATVVDRNEAVNAWMQVNDYRESNELVTRFWYKCDGNFKKSASEKLYKSTFTYELPSLRKLRYFNIRKQVTGSKTGYTCYTQKKDSPQYNRFRYMFGSRIVENTCQAMARDVFSECMRELYLKKYDVVLQIHDEVVVEVDEEHANDAVIDIENVMSQSPSWAPLLPVAAEAHVADQYHK